MKIKIGSRKSLLALTQPQLVVDEIKKHHPEMEIEVVGMKTTGDRIQDRTLDKVGGKGLFVKELDRALLEGEVDLCVHSLKDLPMEVHPELPIVAIPHRGDPRDVLVLRENQVYEPKHIGCASQRRRLMLPDLYPHAQYSPIRGNIITRLEKLEKGEVDALVLAAAGLQRVGLEHRIHHYFSTDEMLPSAGQGALVVQGRKDFDVELLSLVHHEETALCVLAERSFTATLFGGCTTPVAAYAYLEGDVLQLEGFYEEDGRTLRKKHRGPKEKYLELGEELAHAIREELRER